MEYLSAHEIVSNYSRRRLEEMDERLAAQDQRSGESRARIERLEDAAAKSTSSQVCPARLLCPELQSSYQYSNRDL